MSTFNFKTVDIIIIEGCDGFTAWYVQFAGIGYDDLAFSNMMATFTSGSKIDGDRFWKYTRFTRIHSNGEASTYYLFSRIGANARSTNRAGTSLLIKYSKSC